MGAKPGLIAGLTVGVRTGVVMVRGRWGLASTLG